MCLYIIYMYCCFYNFITILFSVYAEIFGINYWFFGVGITDSISIIFSYMWKSFR